MCPVLRTLDLMSFVPPKAASIQQVLSSAIDGRPVDIVQEVDPSVAALITVEQDLTYLSQTLNALVGQTVLPGLLIVADCSGATLEPLYSDFQVARPRLSGHLLSGSSDPCKVEIQVVRARGASSFGDAIGKALGYARIPDETRGLWLLHDDARPMDSTCLETLIEYWRRSPTAAILGTKQFDWEGRGLQDVGRYAYRHTTVGLVVEGEPDQEQYDSRQDVFSVSLAGALVPLETLKNLRGIGPWAGTFGQSDDFCRQVCLSGGRVLVVPDARIAHARARYRGIRDRNGRQVAADRPADSSMPVIDAGEQYLLTDFSLVWWPLIWLWRLLAALWKAIESLIAKRPYRALCHLCSPWRLLGHMPSSLMMRQGLMRVSVTGLNKLHILQANRQQVLQWRQRQYAFRDQLGHPMLSHLALAHLRKQRGRRITWACGMTILVLVFLLATNWSVCRAVASGATIHSALMISSGATWSQLFSAATTSWTWGGGVGMPAAATPFLLVLMGFACLTGGHVAWAMILMMLVEVPLSALSFWALAGIYTRSNPVRVATGLLWSCMAFALGAVGDVNLPILTVLAFMPASFAFVFKAVGLYRTEEPAQPHASVQSAALAAICFVPVILSEPQLLLGLILVFLILLCMVPSHKATLFLIPIPSILALAPTLINVVRHFGEGLWRQLFADVTLPSSLIQGEPKPNNLLDLVTQVLGLDISQGWVSLFHSSNWIGLILLCSMLVVAVLAFLSLFLPAAMRLSRMMWAVSLVGLVLAVASTSITVGLDQTGPVAGSPLPGLLLTLLAFMACICMVAGGAVRPFHPLVKREGAWSNHQVLTGAMPSPELTEGEPVVLNRQTGLAPRLVQFGRGLLTVILVAVLTVLTFGFLTGEGKSHIQADQNELPMVAVDYLSKNDRHRVLVLSSPRQDQVVYGTMRTARGDLIDVSPGARAQAIAGHHDPAQEQLSSASASLVASVDSSAIEAISGLGYGGIYVPNDSHDSAGGTSTPNENLVSNITACDGSQQVMSNNKGTYFRLTIDSSDRHGIDLTGQQMVAHSAWRKVWLWSLFLVLFAYLLVALPHRRRTEQEES